MLTEEEIKIEQEKTLKEKSLDELWEDAELDPDDEKKVAEFIERTGLNGGGEKILRAVSGGAESSLGSAMVAVAPIPSLGSRDSVP